MGISDRLKLIRDEAGLSQEAFATSIGLKRANYAQIEAGNQNPTIVTLTEIVRKYNKTYEWLIEGIEMAGNLEAKPAGNGFKTAENIIQLTPRVVTVDKENQELIALVPAKAAAGYLNGYSDPEYIESLPSLSLPGFAGHSHRAFEVRGQSMLPTHHSGSIAIGRAVESFNDIRDRRVYIIVTKTDGIVLKRVLNRIKEDGKLILLSDNDNKKEYPNYPLDAEDILELWYWRGSLIRESPEPGGLYHRINDIEARLTLVQNIMLQLNAGNKGFNTGA